MKKLNFFLIIFFLVAGLVYSATETAPTIDVLVIDNYSINPVIANFITDAIEKANAQDDECLIIQIDTPGGLVAATIDVHRVDSVGATCRLLRLDTRTSQDDSQGSNKSQATARPTLPHG